MLWTLGIALGLHRPFLETQAPSSGGRGNDIAARFYLFQKVVTLSLIPFGGASIGALILAVVHRARGGKLIPVQPGHWLLVVYGASYLAFASVRLLLASLGLGEWQQWAMAGVALGIAVVQILPILFVGDAPRWTVFFVVELVRRIGIAATQCLFAIALDGMSQMGIRRDLVMIASSINLVLLLGGIVLVTTLTREVLARPQRDYLHWTGCLTQLMIGAAAMAQFVFPWFLR